MKRSYVNDIIRKADEFIRSFNFLLPPFAYLGADEFTARRSDFDEIVKAGLGWDVTDYGRGDFDGFGLFLFTLRNGRSADLASGRGKLYAEKIMISRRDQVSPLHRHVIKAEDIINRGGAPLGLELFQSTPDGGVDEKSDVRVPCDGVARTVPAGGVVMLQPGESITLMPGIWHSFWGEKGDVLIGEVSTVNDDHTDNVFREEIARFTTIEEDEKPLHLLVSDYPALR